MRASIVAPSHAKWSSHASTRGWKKPGQDSARLKQAGDIRSLVAIAVETGEREVRRFCSALVLQRDYVLHFEWKDGVDLGELTILTPADCASSDLRNHRHAWAAHGAFVLARETCALARRISSSRPTSP